MDGGKYSGAILPSDQYGQNGRRRHGGRLSHQRAWHAGRKMLVAPSTPRIYPVCLLYLRLVKFVGSVSMERPAVRTSPVGFHLLLEFYFSSIATIERQW